MATRFYGPVSSGMFADMVDDLSRAGMTCVPGSPNLVRCTWRGARFTIVRDDDGVRAQLLDDAGLGAHAWDIIDPILNRASAPRTGFANSERVGAFFYDKDLAKFGNAFSPFVQAPSFEAANLALQRPFQDRYNPRYDNQPTWADWMTDFPIPEGVGMPEYGMEYAVGVDMACQPPMTPEELGDAVITHRGIQKSCEECGNCDSPGWIAHRARYATSGSFEAVDRRALLATAVIAGITTLLALNHKEHWLEISAAGVGGIALAWGLSAGAKSTITLR
jgi:hypothetical protein